MPKHQSQVQNYTLRDLLSDSIDPRFTRKLIDEIKSPLCEQSFVVTMDNTICIDQQISYRAPKRPNIPPTPTKKQSLCRQFQIENPTYSRDSLSIYDYGTKEREGRISRSVMEEIVSPLDFDINQSIEPVPEVSTVDKLVGLLKGLFWTDKNGAKKRRKIFQHKDVILMHSKTSKPKLYEGQGTSLFESIRKLKQAGETQKARFLTFLGDLSVHFTELSESQPGQHQIGGLHHLIAKESAYIPAVSNINETHTGILRRLQARNTYEVLALFKPQLQQTAQEHQQSINLLQKLFTILSNIQQTISSYLNEPQTLEYLHRIYGTLSSSASNLCTQLLQMLHDLDVRQLDGKISDFNYIWKQMNRKKLTEGEFIGQLYQNKGIYRGMEEHEEQLIKKGYVRN